MRATFVTLAATLPFLYVLPLQAQQKAPPPDVAALHTVSAARPASTASSSASTTNLASGSGAAATVPTAPPKNIVPGHIIHYEAPVYPPQARAAHIKGSVVLSVTIGPKGNVESAYVLSSPPLLGEAAVQAVHKWVYTPWKQDGQPTEATSKVTLNF